MNTEPDPSQPSRPEGSPAHAGDHGSESRGTTNLGPESRRILDGDQRVGHLEGDRLCTGCGYNLIGQHIVREGHYDMLIVRCPECGTVAALQEYPVLGRWATRWATVLAGLWVLVLFVLWMASGGMIFGLTNSLGQRAVQPYVAFLGDHQRAWMAEQGLDEDPNFRWMFSGGFHSRLDHDWREAHDRAALVSAAREEGRLINRRAFWLWPANSIWLIVMGVVWSLLLPQVARRWLPLASLGLVGLGALFWLIGLLGHEAMIWHIGELARHHVGMRIEALTLLFYLVPLTIGLLIGRSVARLLIRALLPPRLRSALAGVWRIDGLPPPGSRGRMQPR